MNYEMKEKMIESIWDFWHENKVSWQEIFTYLQKEFPNEIMWRLEQQVNELDKLRNEEGEDTPTPHTP